VCASDDDSGHVVCANDDDSGHVVCANDDDKGDSANVSRENDRR
jgi:hypothetical protein